MTARSSEALEVLREVWRSRGQDAEDLSDDDCAQKECKRMADVGFDDFAAGAPDPAAAWRTRLEREGKLAPAGGTVRDLVVGPPVHDRS
jgi:hypothetical protein